MVCTAKRLERGAAAIEMALVLPVLILVLGGIIDFGRLFYTQIMLTNAAREGARAGIIAGGDPLCRARGAAGADCITGLGSYVPGWQTPQVTGVCPGASPTSYVEVETRAQFRYFFLNAIPGVTSPTTLTQKARMGCT